MFAAIFAGAVAFLFLLAVWVFVRRAIARSAFERIFGFPVKSGTESSVSRQDRVDLVLTGLEVSFLTACGQHKSLFKSSASLILRSEARAQAVCAHQRYFWAMTLADEFGFDVKKHGKYLEYIRHEF